MDLVVVRDRKPIWYIFKVASWQVFVVENKEVRFYAIN